LARPVHQKVGVVKESINYFLLEDLRVEEFLDLLFTYYG